MPPSKKYPFKVIKPPLTDAAMCVYRMKFSNGFYYIGGTCNLGNRITKHLIDLSKKNHTSIINSAFLGCTSVTFEFIEFINDRCKLIQREDFHLSMNVGRSKCLNQKLKSYTQFGLNNGRVKVVRFNSKGEIVNTYSSITDAASSVGRCYRDFISSLKSGHKIKGIVFRRLDGNGSVIEPPKIEKKPILTCKPVIQFDLSMREIKRFYSMGEAERITKISRRTIQDLVEYKRYASRGGFIFRYESSLKGTI